MKVALTLAAVLCSLNLHAYPKIPRVQDNPGHLCSVNDRDFERFRYGEQIPYCRRNVSSKTKEAICKSYGVTNRKNYTVDHIIPLSLGGSNDWKNLWCQSKKIHTGSLEYYYYEKVSEGSMTQAEAVHALIQWKFDPEGKDHIPQPPMHLQD